ARRCCSCTGSSSRTPKRPRPSGARSMPSAYECTGPRSACARCSVPTARLTGPFLSSSSRTELPMDLDTMLDEAAPARHVRLDGPDSPAAVSLCRQIIAQPPAAARARRRYRLAVPVIAGACAIVALAFISIPARHDTTAVAVLNQAALTAARQPAAAVPGPGQYVYVETIEGQRDGAGI